jgi:predicted transcriptional regulator of viral defense system
MKSQFTEKTLPKYVDYLQARGSYVFTQEQALNVLKSSQAALRLSIHRLLAKKRIAQLRRGFYVIVPMEYETAGILPTSWYITAFMRHYKLPYYVGLLSAAALYGAAHQQPQEFQIITTKPTKPIILPRGRIKFFVKKKIIDKYILKKQTETGYISISSPELTAYDLIQYIESSGHLNNVATVLIELAESIDSKTLASVARNSPLVIVQRLGFLLEQFTNLNVELVYQWLKTQNIRTTPLRPNKTHKRYKRNNRWKVWINEKVEPDL